MTRTEKLELAVFRILDLLEAEAHIQSGTPNTHNAIRKRNALRTVEETRAMLTRPEGESQ